MLKIGVDDDGEEMTRLRGELGALQKSKQELDKRLVEVVEQKRASAEKISILLSENSGLVSECDSLTAAIKIRDDELAELKLGLAKMKDSHQSAMEVMKGEKEIIEVKLRGVEAALVRS